MPGMYLEVLLWDNVHPGDVLEIMDYVYLWDALNCH